MRKIIAFLTLGLIAAMCHAQIVNPPSGGGGAAPAGTNAVQASNANGTALVVATSPQVATTLFVPTSGATADYKFQDGTGTTVADSSGNGNTATFNSSGPTWTSTGLSFVPGQGVALPAALNGTQTFVAAFYVNPITTGNNDPSNPYPFVVTSSLDNLAANLTEMTYNGGTTNNIQTANYPGVFRTSHQTIGLQPATGFHVVSWELGISGTSVDHVYVDGIEVSYKPPQAANGGLQTSGNFFIGASLGVFSNAGLYGTMYRMRTYSTMLTAAQVQQVSQSMAQEVASRGVQEVPSLIASSQPVIHFIGDSITFGLGVATPYPTLITLASYPTFTPVNWGIPGANLQAMVANESNRVDLQCTTTMGPAIATVFAGTNDWITGGSGFSVLQNLIGEVQTLKKAGCQVYVVTMLSRGGGQDTNKNLYDGQILQFWKNGGADGVIDIAANPLLGADGASANATYFQSDQVHPTQAGQQLLANAFQNTLNYFFGNNLANPNVVTANTYQMLSSDGAVTAAPTGAAAYTMPDCTGPSGVTYTISNPQAISVLTIVGQSNQPINGLATPITIPSNSTVTLRDVANPKTVSGCHWVM